MTNVLTPASTAEKNKFQAFRTRGRSRGIFTFHQIVAEESSQLERAAEPNLTKCVLNISNFHLVPYLFRSVHSV